MKIFYFLILTLFISGSQAQIKISGTIIGYNEKHSFSFNVPFSNWIHPQNEHVVLPDKNGNFQITLPVTGSQIFFLNYEKKIIYLYGEPGKTLIIKTEAKDPVKALHFSGTLANENSLRHAIGLTHYELGTAIKTDSRIIATEVLKQIRKNQQEITNKISHINFTYSASFIQMLRADIRYFLPSKVWQLIWDTGVLSTSNPTPENRMQWMQVLREAHEGLPVSDDEAINSYHYQQMISYYPRFLERKFDQKDSMQQLVSMILEKPFGDAMKEMRAKGQEYWEYTVYDKLLTGKAKEKILAAFLIKCYDNGELRYQLEAYNRYQTNYPAGEFLVTVEKKMVPFLNSLSAPDPGQADIEIETTGTRFMSLDSVLIKHKGKLVYIDLWGTWCGPCRDQFRFTRELKQRFKGKPVDFLYIAKETRPDPESYWRQMIRFYNLSGRHLMMDKDLEEHFKNMYGKGGGLVFPSYMLADKNGRIISIHFKQPSDREQLYSEIEKFL